MQEEVEDRHSRVQAIPGLVVADGLGPVNDRRRLLLTAGRWKAVHEDAALGGDGHDGVVNLERREDLEAGLLLLLGDVVAHPRVCVDDVDALAPLLAVMEDLDGAAGAVLCDDPLALIDDFLDGLKVLVVRAADVALHAEQGAATHEVVCDVVHGVPAVCKLYALEAVGELSCCREFLLDGHEVADHLERVAEVVKGVDAGHRGVLGHLPHHLLGGQAGCADVHHAREDLSGVLDGLLAANVGVRAELVVDRVSAEARHGCLQGDTGAEGRLGEEGEQGLVGRTRSVLRGVLLHVERTVDKVRKLLGAEGRDSEQVAGLLERHFNFQPLL